MPGQNPNSRIISKSYLTLSSKRLASVIFPASLKKATCFFKSSFISSIARAIVSLSVTNKFAG